MAGASKRQKSALKLAEAILVLVLGVVALIYQVEMYVKFEHMRTALKDRTVLDTPNVSRFYGTTDPQANPVVYDVVQSPTTQYIPFTELAETDETRLDANLGESAHAVQYDCFHVSDTTKRDECLSSTWTEETDRMHRDADRAKNYSLAGAILFFLPVGFTALAYTWATVKSDSSDGADWTKPTFMNGVPLHLITMSHVLGFFLWMMILGVGLGNDYYKSEWVTTVGTHPTADYVDGEMDQKKVYEHFTHNFVRVFILNAIIFAGHLTVHFSEPTDLSALIGSVTGGMKSAKGGTQISSVARAASSLRAVTVSKMV